MLGAQPRRLPQRFAFVLVPRFSMIAFTGAVECLRLANREQPPARDHLGPRAGKGTP